MVNVYIPEQEEDPNLRNDYHRYARAGTLDVLGATFQETLYYNPLNALDRLAEQYLGKGTTGRVLSKDEWSSSEYYREGLEVGDDGITEGLATLLADRHDERFATQLTLSRSRGGLGLGAAQFGVALAGSILDPINVASAFIPTVGVARLATGASRLGKNGNRFLTGVVDGAVGAAIVEPIVISAAAAEQDRDYGLMDSFLNVAVGAGLGGGLHWGVGKLTDRINKTSAQTRQQAQIQSIADAINDQETTAGRVIEDAEKAAFSRNSDVDTITAYDTEGNPIRVKVVETDVEGNILVRDKDGNEQVLDQGELRAKSPFDEDYAYDYEDGLPPAKLSELSDDVLKDIAEIIDGKIEVAQELDDQLSFAKESADKKAVEIEQKRRRGEAVQRPDEPDKPLPSNLIDLQRKLEDAEGKEAAEFDSDDTRKKAALKGAVTRANKKLVNAVRSFLGEQASEQDVIKLLTRLQEQSQAQRLDEQAVVKNEGSLTAQQVDDLKGAQAIQSDNLGKLAEFREAVDEIDALSTEMDNLDPVKIEQQNQIDLEGLQSEEVQSLLPDDIKAALRSLNELDDKAGQYENLTQAGAACVIRTRGT